MAHPRLCAGKPDAGLCSRRPHRVIHGRQRPDPDRHGDLGGGPGLPERLCGAASGFGPYRARDGARGGACIPGGGGRHIASGSDSGLCADQAARLLPLPLLCDAWIHSCGRSLPGLVVTGSPPLKLRHVLCGVDGSDAACRAADRAARLAVALGAELTFLAVATDEEADAGFSDYSRAERLHVEAPPAFLRRKPSSASARPFAAPQKPATEMRIARSGQAGSHRRSWRRRLNSALT
ncbi:hypothetical protein FAZ78_05070 [Cereibacter changlensis]|uniref:UspA domain-containing protein n=1 Tax=Cereibacter changlensis TaxID=402884 RepID=A0A4U0Z363_9RHOB|nr:hypothetical protein FAZ78_05070 [Cereibacter changlensis]